MALARLLRVGCLVLVGAGCGGKVSEPGTGTGGASQGKDGGSGSDGVPSRPLGACHPGTPPSAGLPCPWLSDGLCYPSLDEACNCACPRDHASTCLSDFPNGPDGRVAVTCS